MEITSTTKSSKNIAESLASAIAALRCGCGIILVQNNGSRIALYPAEFLAEKSRFSGLMTDNKTAISLAKRAGLLPMLAVVPENAATENWAIFLEEHLEKSLNSAPQLLKTARAKLPIEGAEDSELVSFRVIFNDEVHLALIIGKPKNNEQIPLVRVHSSCVTGDLLGSLRCDCGGQLQLALSTIKTAGYGVLLYLNQEGRGIGITNKLRTYCLQEQGMDTYEANHAIGFDSDERDFCVASLMLKTLNINKIILLSNNPHKMQELAKYGVDIVERVPLLAPVHAHNQAYLSSKQKAGHILD